MANKSIYVALNLKDNLSKGLLKTAKSMDKVDKGALSATRSVLRFKNKTVSAINSVVKSTVKMGAVAMTAFAGYSLKAGMDFEAQMSKVAAISGAAGEEFTKLSKAAKEMGAKTKYSATESAQALEYMAMAGWKADQMVAGLPGIMNLAAGTGEELASVSDIVTDALTAFGLKAEDSAHFADVLARASSSSNTNVAMMGETFQYAAPVAGALGYSIEDVAVAVGLMANSGIKASNAGTALRGMLTNLAKPTDQVEGYLTKLRVSMTDASGEIKPLSQLMVDLRKKFAGLTEAQKTEYAAGIAGKNAMSGLLAIVNASEEDFQKLTNSIAGSDGAAQAMANTASDNLKGKLTLLKSAAEGVGITFYEAIQDKAKGAVELLTDKLTELQQNGTIDRLATQLADGLAKGAELASRAFQWLSAHGETVKDVLVTVGTALATVKVLKFASDTITAVKNIKTFLSVAGAFVSANPIVLGFGAAVVAVTWLVTHLDKAKGALKAVGDAAKKVFSWIGDKLEGLGKAVEKVPILGGLVTKVKGAVGFATAHVSGDAGSGGRGGGFQTRVPGNALGTSYFSGGLTRVNERGGEIMRLPGGTQIIPHDLSKRMMGGASVQVSVTVQGNVIGNEAYADYLGSVIGGRVLAALGNV